jgi:hypothetical protein
MVFGTLPPWCSTRALGLVAKEAGRADDVLELGRVGGRQGLGRGPAAEEDRRHHVHAHVGALSGQDGGGEKLEGVLVVELAGRVGIEPLQSIDDGGGDGAAAAA